jgi:hypothetical protein
MMQRTAVLRGRQDRLLTETRPTKAAAPMLMLTSTPTPRLVEPARASSLALVMLTRSGGGRAGDGLVPGGGACDVGTAVTSTDAWPTLKGFESYDGI